MDIEDATLIIFTLCNSLRVLAYLPQIYSAARDTGNCSSISCVTWGLFLLAHASAVAYAVVNLADVKMALVFSGNGICCAIILAIAAYKRSRHIDGRRIDRGQSLTPHRDIHIRGTSAA